MGKVGGKIQSFHQKFPLSRWLHSKQNFSGPLFVFLIKIFEIRSNDFVSIWLGLANVYTWENHTHRPSQFLPEDASSAESVCICGVGLQLSFFLLFVFVLPRNFHLQTYFVFAPREPNENITIFLASEEEEKFKSSSLLLCGEMFANGKTTTEKKTWGRFWVEVWAKAWELGRKTSNASSLGVPILNPNRK